MFVIPISIGAVALIAMAVFFIAAIVAIALPVLGLTTFGLRNNALATIVSIILIVVGAGYFMGPTGGNNLISFHPLYLRLFGGEFEITCNANWHIQIWENGTDNKITDRKTTEKYEFLVDFSTSGRNYFIKQTNDTGLARFSSIDEYKIREHGNGALYALFEEYSITFPDLVRQKVPNKPYYPNPYYSFKEFGKGMEIDFSNGTISYSLFKFVEKEFNVLVRLNMIGSCSRK